LKNIHLPGPFSYEYYRPPHDRFKPYLSMDHSLSFIKWVLRVEKYYVYQVPFTIPKPSTSTSDPALHPPVISIDPLLSTTTSSKGYRKKPHPTSQMKPEGSSQHRTQSSTVTFLAKELLFEFDGTDKGQACSRSRLVSPPNSFVFASLRTLPLFVRWLVLITRSQGLNTGQGFRVKGVSSLRASMVENCSVMVQY